MSNLDGVPYYDSSLGDVAVPAAVAPLATPPNGSFPSMRTSCIIGSPKLLSDITSRDNIPAGLRAEGMIAYVQSTGITYQLQGGILNANWAALTIVSQTLAQVLAVGNVTGGTNILVTSGDEIRGNPGATGATLTLRGGQSTGAGTTGAGAQLLGGAAATEGAGGSVAITAAAGVTATATARAGGSITLTAGAGVSGGAGGGITLATTAGAVAVNTTGTAGTVIVTAGGAVALYAGSGQNLYLGGNGVSNDVVLGSGGLVLANIPLVLNNAAGTAESLRGGLVTWTNTVATTVATVTLASGSMVSGRIFYDIASSDGTDHQALAGQIAFAAVDKAGALTTTLDTTLQQQALAASSGTLNVAWSVVDGANLFNLQITITSSLTPTTRSIRLRTEFGGAGSLLTIP